MCFAAYRNLPHLVRARIVWADQKLQLWLDLDHSGHRIWCGKGRPPRPRTAPRPPARWRHGRRPRLRTPQRRRSSLGACRGRGSARMATQETSRVPPFKPQEASAGLFGETTLLGVRASHKARRRPNGSSDGTMDGTPGATAVHSKRLVLSLRSRHAPRPTPHPTPNQTLGNSRKKSYFLDASLVFWVEVLYFGC